MVIQYLKDGCKKEGDRLFSKVCGDRTKGNCFKLKEGRFRLYVRERFFLCEALSQVAQRGGGCPIPEDV